MNTASITAEIFIEPAGQMQFIYADDLRDLFEAGATDLRRASHVEPKGSDWVCDLSPFGGPTVGPFQFRSEALAFEREWLNRAMSAKNKEQP